MSLPLGGPLLRIAILLFAVLPTCTSAQTIGVFADSLGTDCRIDVAYPGPPVDAYVVFTGFDLEPAGVGTPVFRVAGLPDGWAVSFPSTTVFGDVFTDGGHVLVPGCSTAERYAVKIRIVPSSETESNLSVLPHSTNPQQCSIEHACLMPCPRYCTCAGFGECMCAQGLTTSINRDGCQVAVQQRAWSLVKRVYQE